MLLQHTVADNIVAPWPGLLSNGPNTDPADPVNKALPRQAPMRTYVDDKRAYSSNEPITSCNAPLVFLLAALHAR
jgi:endoglucanase